MGFSTQWNTAPVTAKASSSTETAPQIVATPQLRQNPPCRVGLEYCCEAGSLVRPEPRGGVERDADRLERSVVDRAFFTVEAFRTSAAVVRDAVPREAAGRRGVVTRLTGRFRLAMVTPS
ncbi:hypothetical protein GCM10027167_53610 [Nocardia heshunensis]